jgi:hypothetical protein
MSEILLSGQDAEFTVGVRASTSPLAFAWRWFDFYIRGATNQTLTILDVNANVVGPYSVVVSNVSGVVTSMVAQLTVVTGPMPGRFVVAQGSNATFRVAVNGDPSQKATNQWFFNGEPLPAANNFSLTLTNVQPFQSGPYSARVSNAAGAVTTTNAFLEVIRPPFMWGIRAGPLGMSFQVNGEPLEMYVTEAVTNWPNWQPIATNLAPASGTFEVVDPDWSSFNWRCYRVFHP